MKLSLASEAEQELVESARFYAREANAELGHAFISEFERSTELLLAQPHLGSVWRGVVRRLPMRRFPYRPKQKDTHIALLDGTAGVGDRHFVTTE